MYLLKAKNKTAKIEFKTILKGICYHIPERDRHSLEEANGFMELIQIIKDQKIRSIGEIKDKKKSKIQIILLLQRIKMCLQNKPNITRDFARENTNVQCITRDVPHYFSKYPNKKMKVKKRKV